MTPPPDGPWDSDDEPGPGESDTPSAGPEGKEESLPRPDPDSEEAGPAAHRVVAPASEPSHDGPFAWGPGAFRDATSDPGPARDDPFASDRGGDRGSAPEIGQAGEGPVDESPRLAARDVGPPPAPEARAPVPPVGGDPAPQAGSPEPEGMGEARSLSEALGRRIPPAVRLPPPPVPAEPPLQWLQLDTLVETSTYRLRSVEAVAALAESIARRGQRTPVAVRPYGGGYQLVAGHRRLAAVRLLHRGRILARVHTRLREDEALLLALTDDLDRRPWNLDEREALRARLEEEGRLAPAVASLLDRAQAQEHAPPEAEAADLEEEVELDLEELATRVRDALADAANDLALLYEDWGDLDEGRREDVVEVVRYLKEMYPFLVGPTEDDE